MASHMFDVFGFGYDVLFVEPIPVDGEVVVVLDREVEDLETDDVVEEVGPLTHFRRNTLERGLYDDLGAADLGPCDGNAEKGIGGTPSAEANKNIGSSLGDERLIEFFDLSGHLEGLCRVEGLWFDVDDISDVVAGATAENICRCNDHTWIR